MYGILCLTTLSHRSVVPYYFPDAMMGLGVTLISVMSWCDLLTWPFWKSSISIDLEYFLVACCGPKYIVIYLRCSWVAHWDPMHILRCSSVAWWEPMVIWYLSMMSLVAIVELLWMSFDAFLAHGGLLFLFWIFFQYFILVACIGLKWFDDLWFHEIG